MSFATFSGVTSLLLLILFIGIVAWAWSSRRKRDFEEAARLPLDDDERPRPERPARDSQEGSRHE